uniref:Uncharacterized protein n=1 Tax=Anguilla anguilla TaxID=7936 RepID=A0A0E9Q5V3_ANGAN
MRLGVRCFVGELEQLPQEGHEVPEHVAVSPGKLGNQLPFTESKNIYK